MGCHDQAIDFWLDVSWSCLRRRCGRVSSNCFLCRTGWDRIAYRIDSAGSTVAKGILSVGAIASNLLDLRMASPARPIARVPLSVRIYAGNPVTRKPFRGVHLEARLVIDADIDPKAKSADKTVVRQAVTDRLGEAVFAFPFPTKPGQTATLTVTGTLNGSASPGASDAHATASISKDFEASDRTLIRVETDKPLHKPGETVHMRALVFTDAGQAAANIPMTLTIKDPDSKTLLEAPLITNRFGIVSDDWKTGAHLAPGDYNAEFDIGDSSDSNGTGLAMIRIQRYELPEFAVSAAMDKGFYLEGQTPVVHIHAGYLFGMPVAEGSLRIARASGGGWDRRTGKYKESDDTEQTANLDQKGDAELHLDVKSDFEDFKEMDYQRYNDLQYRAIVTDATTGRSEPRNFTVRLTRDPVHMYLDALGGNEHEGDYLLTTSYADGSPAAAKVTLDWMDAGSHPTRAAVVSTNRLGLAIVHLHYPAPQTGKSEFGLRLVAHDAEGRSSKFDDSVNPNTPRRIWITVAHDILKPGDAIEATVHAAAGSIVDVDVLSETGVLGRQHLRMTSATEPLTVPAGPGFHGVIVLQAYAMNGDGPEYRYGWSSDEGYKAVLYPEDHELKLKLTGLRPSYSPGAVVDAGLTVKNANGAAPPSVLGISVFDTAVQQRAETESEANDRWFGWNWWDDGESVGGVTLDTLNRIDTAQPIPDDLEMAAEKLLLWPNINRIEIEANYDNTVREEYETAMNRVLEPLDKAVLQARPTRLPGSLDALQAIARAAKLDDAILIDPWNTPYRVRREIQSDDEVVSLVSAGPDKHFGSGDDFDLELCRRNLFALQGDRLVELLTAAVREGQSLPGTLDGLKALAVAGGLNLDAIFDPDGKPYVYAILVQRRFYSVQVSNHAGNTMWTSPSIDYFSSAEARIEKAIRDWTAAGKLFPDTEAEARQAFSAAGIDFDAMRDPLGKPFQLRLTQVMAYTRVETVKAGSNLDVKGKPVTHLLRAIQVLRSPDRAAGEDAPGDADVVAQFLHPITEQSGSDAIAQAVDRGTFKGNTGAIGGTVSDQTGALIPGATVEVKTIEGEAVASAKTGGTGTFLIPDLAPGFYDVAVNCKGFVTYKVREVHVYAVSLTTIDAILRVSGDMNTVTVVSGMSAEVATDSAEVSGVAKSGTGRNREVVVSGPNGKATISEPTFTPRLRHVFDETAYWAPSLETGANGRANIRFTLPDSLTTWKLHALASTIDGRVGVLEQSFKTFQPFFVDLDAPQVLTVGDEISLPVNLRNYTDHSLTLPVIAKPADWFTLLTPSTINASVPSNGTTPEIFGFRAVKAVEAGPLRITAANTREGDAVEKTVRVHPDGEPRAVTASSLLRSGSSTLALDLPADAIPGSVHAELLLYPNLRAHILHSMKAVLERPWGCGEQTISSTYPDLLFLELIKTAGVASPLQDEAQTYLQLGYDRLLGYFDQSGGLTYWGGADHKPDPALTAYGVEFLTEAGPYVTVDQARIVDAVGWLVRNQEADGSWKPHYGDTKADLNLYIAAALKRALASDDFTKASTKDLRDKANGAMAKAQAWAATSVAAVHDPYANALRLRMATDDPTKARLRAELTRTAIHDRHGVHWESIGYSPFYSWGHAGELETTATVLAALGEANASAEDRALANDALFYLICSKDRYGIWYSGQATVRVLQAMLPLASAEMKAPAGSQESQLAINGVPLAEKDAEQLRADPRLLEAPRSLDLTALLKPGHNELVFSSLSDAALASAEASVSFYVPWPNTPTPETAKTQTGTDHGFDFAYNCAAANARVGQPVDCTVDVRRFGSNSYGMLLAEIGLPPGADVDRASLGKLLDNWTISRYELQPDRIVFYIWSWKAEGTHLKFTFKPRYAIHAKAAPATLFDYYNPDLKAVLAPQTFVAIDLSRK